MADHAGFDPSEVFVYRGKGSIPKNARRVEVDRSVKFIPDRLFSGCDQLESLLLHDGLMKIGRYAFKGCSSLSNIKLPSTVTEIGAGAFKGCSNLAAIELPDGLDAIEAVTFYGCTSLEAMRIPSSVAWIGLYAFYGCRNLRLLELREGLRTIGYSTFYECGSLESLRVPSSVDEIAEYAFDGCSTLASVQLHEYLPRIKEHAFRGCPLESFRFVPLSERVEAIRVGDQTKSMLDSRLREMTRALTGSDRDDEDEDDSDDEGGAEAVREKCKECLVRAHEFLTYLELKGAVPVLELALWKMKIDGERGEGAQGGVVNSQDGGHDLSDAGRHRKRPKVTKNVGQDTRLSREDCRVKSGADVVLPEVLKFFTYSSSWPPMDDSEEVNVD